MKLKIDLYESVIDFEENIPLKELTDEEENLEEESEDMDTNNT